MRKRIRTAIRLAWERYCHALALNGAALKMGEHGLAEKYATRTKTWGERHSRLLLMVRG